MADQARAARQVRIQIGPPELRDPVVSFRDWRAPTAMGDKAAVRAQLLLGVAHGTLSAFVGRNNDVDGYWAIGKICRHAVELGTPAVTFDLLAGTASPRVGTCRCGVRACDGTARQAPRDAEALALGDLQRRHRAGIRPARRSGGRALPMHGAPHRWSRPSIRGRDGGLVLAPRPIAGDAVGAGHAARSRSRRSVRRSALPRLRQTAFSVPAHPRADRPDIGSVETAVHRRLRVGARSQRALRTITPPSPTAIARPFAGSETALK